MLYTTSPACPFSVGVTVEAALALISVFGILLPYGCSVPVDLKHHSEQNGGEEPSRGEGLRFAISATKMKHA